jgi:hypothetical protein
MSVDPLVKWNPNSLLDKPGNWHAVRYASNRPLEYVDRSGSFVVKVGLSTGASAGLGISGAVGIAGSYSKLEGFSFGTYESAGGGAVAGIPGPSIAFELSISDEANLEQGSSECLKRMDTNPLQFS